MLQMRKQEGYKGKAKAGPREKKGVNKVRTRTQADTWVTKVRWSVEGKEGATGPKGERMWNKSDWQCVRNAAVSRHLLPGSNMTGNRTT